MYTKAETIHGYQIIAIFHTPGDYSTRAGRVILVDKGEQSLHQRYVTAWQGEIGGIWDKEWSSGNYFILLSEAYQDFTERCRRWIK